MTEAVNHWEDYGIDLLDPKFACTKVEHCSRCGLLMEEHFEPGVFRSRRTGGPTYVRYHSCPTWFRGWRARWRWSRLWAMPGYGHDSHDADNPLSARAYR